jgi:hypothetical protein
LRYLLGRTTNGNVTNKDEELDLNQEKKSFTIPIFQSANVWSLLTSPLFVLESHYWARMIPRTSTDSISPDIPRDVFLRTNQLMHLF